MASVAECVPIKLSEIDRLISFAKEFRIGLTVVGPDDALAAGMVDRFEAEGLRIFGPRQACAQLESSKVFAKEFMQRYGIPTARSANFTDSGEARKFARSMSLPLVIKADGLALGKGVIIAESIEQVDAAIREIMDERRFGDAGRAIVIEECLEGPECSIHALVDGGSYLMFPSAQDHKRALDNDAGLNTGGMGTYSPAPQLTAELEARVRSEVLDRFLEGIRAEGLDFRGMLFPGLMLTADGPKVLEFNCRFGDPETQVLLARLESDLLELLESVIDGTLAKCRPVWAGGAAVCVIAASGGYPGDYVVGKPISGLGEVGDKAIVFHAGTRLEGAGLVTAGGRVFGMTSVGSSLRQARDEAYAALARVSFEGMHFRRDIAEKGLQLA